MDNRIINHFDYQDSGKSILQLPIHIWSDNKHHELSLDLISFDEFNNNLHSYLPEQQC